jgi:hypothetical protein
MAKNVVMQGETVPSRGAPRRFSIGAMTGESMKEVWSSPSLVQCDLVKAMLEGEGIECAVRNESNARFAGIGYPLLSGQTLAFAWPQLWVPDEQFERASEIVRDYSKGHEETLERDKQRLSGNEAESDDS